MKHITIPINGSVRELVDFGIINFLIYQTTKKLLMKFYVDPLIKYKSKVFEN